MKTTVKFLFLISIIALIISFFFVNRLPPKNAILKQLYNEPIQSPSFEPEFTVQKKNITYRIKPLYTYEMYGLVVTYHHSSSFMDISHREWKDFLNIKDISLIWGYNIKMGDYLKVKYSHADWTGYYQYYGTVNFNADHFSNNHLLTENPSLEKEIMRTRIGDQIYVKGYLVEYSHNKSNFKRGTSSTRNDTGNGACETIYVTDYKIMKAANPQWRSLNRLSKYILTLSAGYLFVSTFFMP